MDNAKRDWGFETIVSAVKVATFRVRGQLEKIQLLYEDEDEAVPACAF